MSIHTKSLPQYVRFEEQELLDSDILRLNSIYFLKLREMAQSDPDTASVIFGCKPELIKAIAEASAERYQSFFSSIVMQFRPLFDQNLLVEQLENPTDAKSLSQYIRSLQDHGLEVRGEDIDE